MYVQAIGIPFLFEIQPFASYTIHLLGTTVDNMNVDIGLMQVTLNLGRVGKVCRPPLKKKKKV